MLSFGLQIKAAEPTGKFRDIQSPFDGRTVGRVEIPDIAHQELALESAAQSFENIMKKMPAWKRAEILYRVADFIKRDKELLSQTIAAEGGKPVKDARIEVTRAANTVKMSGDEALSLNGQQITMDRAGGSENHIAFTIRQGLGVVLAISAFNHPVNLICHQVATAFAAGNSVVVKPASQTPLSCMMVCRYFIEAGLDEGIINVLPISGSETEKLIGDKRVRFVSFIGSAEVGWRIPKLVAPGTGYSLEHGGTAVAVVESTADLDFAATSIVKGGFYHAGQVCVSTQNVFVSAGIYPRLIEMIKEKASKLITGDPNDDATDVGPIINAPEHSRILSQIREAVSMGAKCVLGGDAVHNTCINPTILTDTNYNMAVMKSEVFGPVININKFDKLDDVIQMCNNTPFSFQNAIYTKNIDTALGFARQIDSKAVIINDSTAFRVDWMPFGGSKESGFRVGGIKYSIEDVTEEKLIIIRMHDYDA
ncbi:MAG: aldehyde dehydrogenase family protein [Candidatus Kapabacteria bacterium]|jgi:acyl-CoA reductase-like NAD-dependent aldehyde dehydrogenase|nr:aldehyde dehydrogenase family protein [Candidatus Kapabacteria bacterium]